MFKFDVKIDVHVHLPHEPPPSWVDKVLSSLRGLEITMGKIEDKLAVYEGALTTIGEAVTGLSGDLTAQSAEIAALKEQIANGGLTPELETRMDAVGQKLTDTATALAALDALNPATPPANPGDAGNGEAGTNV